jgi:hypothetical protein
MSKDLVPKEVQPFKPTPHMEKWLDTAVELNSDSPKEISTVSELRRANWYDWLKVPGFEDWYYENYKKKRRRWLPTLDKIGMKQAQRGEFNFWKEMNKKAGDDFDGKGGMNIDNSDVKILVTRSD